MSAMTIFYQQCPICGRNLRIPAKYFGRQMSCTHCEGEFRAGKEELPGSPSLPMDTNILPGVVAPGLFAQSPLHEA